MKYCPDCGFPWPDHSSANCPGWDVSDEDYEPIADFKRSSVVEAAAAVATKTYIRANDVYSTPGVFNTIMAEFADYVDVELESDQPSPT